jgi:hypothetical protein
MLRLPAPAYIRPKQSAQWVCLAETLDHCIGSQTITDILVQAETRTTYYVFESGHQLPLLCGCCGQPLVYDPLAFADIRADEIGRRLEAFHLQDSQSEDGSVFAELVLEFSGRTAVSAGTTVAVSMDVLAHLRHPSRCPRLRLGPRAR